MIFSEDSIKGQIETVNPKWEYIENSLRKFDPDIKTYFSLTDELSSYVQCAGEKDRLTIEYRKFSDKSFRHYILGHKKNDNTPDIIWTQISCKVGPIHIHLNEALTIQDAITIFKAFYKKADLPVIYNKRNITKQFEK